MTNTSKDAPSVDPELDVPPVEESEPDAPIEDPMLPSEIEPDAPIEVPESDPFDEGNFPI